MSMGTLTMVAESVSGTLVGADRPFESVSTDTRTLQPGQLFFALTGERFDAATLVEEASRRGAAGAVVARRQTCDLPQVEVPDTRRALGLLAKSWRERFPISVIAVTGSNGKTTVKEMLDSILSLKAPVLATQGNLNNEIGVPLTLFDLDDSHHFAVIEMGANHAGEIAWLSQTGRPTVALITHCGPTHLEGFGDRVRCTFDSSVPSRDRSRQEPDS